MAEVAGEPGPRRHHGEGKTTGEPAAKGPRGGCWGRGDAERACHPGLESSHPRPEEVVTETGDGRGFFEDTEQVGLRGTWD